MSKPATTTAATPRTAATEATPADIPVRMIPESAGGSTEFTTFLPAASPPTQVASAIPAAKNNAGRTRASRRSNSTICSGRENTRRKLSPTIDPTANTQVNKGYRRAPSRRAIRYPHSRVNRATPKSATSTTNSRASVPSAKESASSGESAKCRGTPWPNIHPSTAIPQDATRSVEKPSSNAQTRVNGAKNRPKPSPMSTTTSSTVASAIRRAFMAP